MTTSQDERTSTDPELRRLIEAMVHHGWTVWSDTTCGRGGAGGQMMTTTYHPELLALLAETALRRIYRSDSNPDDQTLSDLTLEAVDEEWRTYHYPGAASLLTPPKGHRAGPDGRPLPRG